MAWSTGLKLAGWVVSGLTFIASPATAQTSELPVIVSYDAPPPCATADAFQKLVGAEVAHQPNPDRPWRFSVTIRHGADFVGTLDMEGGTRDLHAATCDEVTAALAMIIATAQPQLPAAPAPPPPVLVTPVALPVVRMESAPIQRMRDEARMASPALVGVGIAVSTVGVAAASFGLWRLLTPYGATGVCPGAACQDQIHSANATGVALVSAGAGLTVGGLVMSILGLQRKHVSVEGGPLGSTGATVMVTF